MFLSSPLPASYLEISNVALLKSTHNFVCHSLFAILKLEKRISNVALLKSAHNFVCHSLFVILKLVFGHEIRRQMSLYFET